MDEFHAHADDSVYTTLRTGVMKTPGSKLITICTAGQGTDTPLGWVRARALAQPKVVRRGGFTDARGDHLSLEWSLPGRRPDDAIKAVKRVNPASWITIRDLARAAPGRSRPGIPPLSRQPMDRTRRPLAPTRSVASLHRHPASPRANASGSVSTSAATDSVRRLLDQHRLPGRRDIYHGDQGVLDCVDKVRELADRYEVGEVVFDPWRFGQAAPELT